MDFWQAIVSGFKNYVGFRGRACRSEYWYWVLALIIGGIITAIIDYAAFGIGFGYVQYGPVNSIFSVATSCRPLRSAFAGCTTSTAPAGGR